MMSVHNEKNWIIVSKNRDNQLWRNLYLLGMGISELIPRSYETNLPIPPPPELGLIDILIQAARLYRFRRKSLNKLWEVRFRTLALGLRMTECVLLQVKDFDLDGRCINITKSLKPNGQIGHPWGCSFVNVTISYDDMLFFRQAFKDLHIYYYEPFREFYVMTGSQHYITPDALRKGIRLISEAAGINHLDVQSYFNELRQSEMKKRMSIQKVRYNVRRNMRAELKAMEFMAEDLI